MTIKQPDLFLADTGDFFRTYLAADTMTRNNLVLGMHMRLHEYDAEIKRVRMMAIIAFTLLIACIIGIVVATH